MNDEINVKFTKDEWRILTILINRHIRDLNLEDFNDQKQKLQTQVNSYQRQLNQLKLNDSENRKFIAIVDKMNLY